jgi:hypothetical protein
MKPETANKILAPMCAVFVILTAILIDGIRQGGRQEKVLQNKCDSLVKVCDSVSSELYYYENELNRYQIAYKIFLERNPKSASQYGTIISDETE